jgi:hypothetical protein
MDELDVLNEVEYRVNKYAMWLHDFRVIPRGLTIGYAYMVYDVVNWFMTLPEPTTQQAALLTVVVGMSGAIFGLYTNTTSGLKK